MTDRPTTTATPGAGRLQGGDALLVSVAVVAVSTSGPLIAACAAPALAIAFWRNAMAAGLLAPTALVTARAELAGLSRRELRWAGLAGLMLAAHFATWTPSLTLTSVASATALVATQPVWAALVSGLRGAPVGRTVWAGIGVSVLGAAALAGADVSADPRALAGDALAAAGGAFAALYMTAGEQVRRTVTTTTYTLLCYSLCALVLLVVCVVGRQELVGYSGADWLRLAALTLSAQLLGHSLFNRVVKTVGPTVVSTLILLEVPGAAIVAAVFLGQVPPLTAVPAGVLLVVGLAIVVRAGGRRAAAVPVE